MNQPYSDRRQRTIDTQDLQPGMEVYYLGEVRHVLAVRRSSSNGWEVTFSDGPSANFLHTTTIIERSEPNEELAMMAAAKTPTERADQLIAAYRLADIDFIVDELVTFCSRVSGVDRRYFDRESLESLARERFAAARQQA